MAPAQFDQFVEGLNYPMFVVTAAAGRSRAGCLVGFSTQVCIDPPKLMVCLSVQNRTYRVARRALLLAVHVLGPEQHALAELFGAHTGDEVDKFAQCSWTPGPGGVPLLDDCPRYVVGRLLGRIPFGDHTGFVIQPLAVDAKRAGAGLTFEDVQDLDPGHPA